MRYYVIFISAIVHDGKDFIYFAYEGLPVGAGLRGIGGDQISLTPVHFSLETDLVTGVRELD